MVEQQATFAFELKKKSASFEAPVYKRPLYLTESVDTHTWCATLADNYV